MKMKNTDNKYFFRGVLFAESSKPLLPRLDDFPTKNSTTRFLRKFLGVLEFPETTAETAAYFVTKLSEEDTMPLAA